MSTSPGFTIAIFWIVLTTILPARVAGTVRNADWLAQKMVQFEQDRLIEDPEKRIEALASWLSVVAPRPVDEYEWTLYRKTQDALLSIPGHASYYTNKIESLRSKIKSELYDEDEQGNYIREYRDHQGAINIFGDLPSAESVAALGHFINDSEGRDGKTIIGTEHKIDDGFQVNCLLAMAGFNRIGIEKPPVNLKQAITTDNMFEYVEHWKDWWNEVKAGKRTYRFIGSAIEYGPDGPVAPPTSGVLNGPKKRNLGAGSAVVLYNPLLPLVGLVAACALLAAAVWYFIKSRKSA